MTYCEWCDQPATTQTTVTQPSGREDTFPECDEHANAPTGTEPGQPEPTVTQTPLN